ncbi:MAG: GntR family transcriptional regulator [Lachnospiraceae bacterium]|nr:GntR family transcriptional regulator [Lachnospiraceae bacterium]
MIVRIDFNSEEAIYIQLRNQIILGIATSEIREGDNLPSVRELADHIGINMHTVNKAYTILKQEGYVKLDRRKGAVVAVDADKMKALADLTEQMRVILAEAVCRNISCQEIHEVMDQIFREFACEGRNGGADDVV